MTATLYEMPENLEIAPETAEYLNTSLAEFSDEDIEILKRAVTHALSLHADQDRRPSGETYGNHILRVAARLANDFGIVDKELFIAALYHDAVEDQMERLCIGVPVSRDNAFRYLAKRYSSRVADVVGGVTNPETLENMGDKEASNREYIRHVIEECDKNVDSFVIKLSDFFDNAMRMQFNTTEAAKVRGAKKYMPLFDYFYGRLQRDDIVQIDGHHRQIFMDAIAVQREYARGLIQ